MIATSESLTALFISLSLSYVLCRRTIQLIHQAKQYFLHGNELVLNNIKQALPGEEQYLQLYQMAHGQETAGPLSQTRDEWWTLLFERAQHLQLICLQQAAAGTSAKRDNILAQAINYEQVPSSDIAITQGYSLFLKTDSPHSLLFLRCGHRRTVQKTWASLTIAECTEHTEALHEIYWPEDQDFVAQRLKLDASEREHMRLMRYHGLSNLCRQLCRPLPQKKKTFNGSPF